MINSAGTVAGHGSNGVLLWDSDAPPPEWAGPVVLWRSFGPASDNIVSLPAEVDRHAQQLRARFLAMVHHWGTTAVEGRSVIDRLRIRRNLSYWWLTLPAQKDVYAASPYIYDILKLLAFEDIAALRGKPITLHSSNPALAEVLASHCGNTGCAFVHARPKASPAARFSMRSLRKRLPVAIRGLLAFLHFIALRYRLGRETATHSIVQRICVFDVFTHLNVQAAAKGSFESNYWSKLATWFEAERLPVNWFHWAYPSPQIPTIGKAISLAQTITRSSEASHSIIDARISMRMILGVLRDLWRLNRARAALQRASLFRVPESNLDLSALLRDDWTDSFVGPRAVLSLFHLQILERTLSRLPRQALGLYIQENQPWEFALCQLWKDRGHGALVGVAHTTIPFWDLRYYFDPRSFSTPQEKLPQPDRIAVNGPDALRKLTAARYPIERCRQVEALRYLSLEGHTGKRGPTSAASKSTPRTVRLLVLGDLLPRYTDRQFEFLVACRTLPGIALELRFRPHPASASYQPRADGLDYALAIGPLIDELLASDAVFVGSATSAAADAFQIGISVISIEEGWTINFSPLYRVPGVTFVRTPADLANALTTGEIDRQGFAVNFFTLDSALPRWKALVADALNNAESNSVE